MIEEYLTYDNDEYERAKKRVPKLSFTATKPSEVILRPSEIAAEWGVSARRVRQLCRQWRVYGIRFLETGEWSLRKGAFKPIDGRKYRYRKVPKAFYLPVQYADTLKSRAKTPFPEDWNYFLIGSAHHMHTIRRSDLTLRDVERIVRSGEMIEGKRKRDQIAVLRHCEAMNFVVKAALEKRKMTKTLVREIYRIIVGKKSARLPLDIPDDLDYILMRARMKDLHPLIQAGDFLNEMFLREPLQEENERIGYFMANFILLRNGYWPIILYRIIFPSVKEHVKIDLKRHLKLQLRRAFINACVIRASIRSYIPFNKV